MSNNPSDPDIPRVLEPEVMDTTADAHDYDRMDHSAVNLAFATDFLAFAPQITGRILDVGTGTAQIPIQLARLCPAPSFVGIDAASEMLKIAALNIQSADLSNRIQVELVDAKQMPYLDGTFSAVISNSIVHHIPEPFAVLAEIVRVCGEGGVIFVRDLLRPQSQEQLRQLVEAYAGEADAHQKQLFAESLHAALTLCEIRELVERLGFPAETVQQTTDRHWTWAAVRPRPS